MKKEKFIVALFLVSMISLAFHTTPVQADPILPPASMVGWWSGDGNTNDLVNNNDGVLLGGAGFDVGMVDQAFSLDGMDDCVQIQDVPVSGVGQVNLDGFSQLTIDAWINPDVVPVASQAIVSKYDSRTQTGCSYYFGFRDNGKLRMVIYELAYMPANHVEVIAKNQVINQSVWTHVACVWLGGSQPSDFALFVNGELIEVEIILSGNFHTMANNNVPVNIGRIEMYISSGQPGAYFDGRIDEVEIFNRALTQSEIQGIYNAGSDGKIKGPPGGIPLFSDILAILPLGIVTGAVVIRRRHKASK